MAYNARRDKLLQRAAAAAGRSVYGASGVDSSLGRSRDC